MSEAGEHLELLKNAVRQSIAALTAVETDTVYQAKELAKMLAAEIGERPHETLSLSVDAGASPLLYQARRISENWIDEEGVLFIIDDGSKDEGKRYPFWVEMNGLRESWAAINCHVIFFLLPHNYRMLLQVGDHFADWMPLKLYIIRESKSLFINSQLNQESVFTYSEGLGMLPPQSALKQISILEKQLGEAIQNETKQTVLIRRYYLPMFEAAISIYDIHRSQNLRQKISETDIPTNDLPHWWHMNCRLDIELRKFDIAESWAKKIITWACENNNVKWQLKGLCSLGRIERKRGNLELAQKYYRKSLDIAETYGDEIWLSSIYYDIGQIARYQSDLETAKKYCQKSLETSKKIKIEYGIAFNYEALAEIAQEERNFETAEELYQKSIEILEKQANERVLSIIYNNLGILYQDRSDFESAERWYKKALKIREKQGDENSSAITYHNLGILARLQDRLESSGEWLIKSIKAFENTNDPENAEKAKEEFQKTYAQASPDVQAKLKEMRDAAGLSEL